ncbi:flavin reductase [Solwaraspora sp. WMMB762]|uniref:flavin reductase n=1 Tax=Solwaraspora sp. WMMB762 TaxID=3404120 RepID=UPI003B954FFA
MHIASRPHWNCRECGTEWPCESAKIEITADWANDRVGMCVYLATLMYEAIDDLLECDAEQLSPPDLYRRFLRWPDQVAESEAIARLSARPGEP